jgi:hypothetical protein
MTQSQPEISPYGTGARCEPKLWQPNSEAVAEVMGSGEAGDIGNVDFTNGENSMVVTVHVSRSDDGLYPVHLGRYAATTRSASSSTGRRTWS